MTWMLLFWLSGNTSFFTAGKKITERRLFSIQVNTLFFQAEKSSPKEAILLFRSTRTEQKAPEDQDFTMS